MYRVMAWSMAVWIALSASRGWAQPLVLVEGGQPRAQVVIAHEPSAQAKQAAGILQDYLRRISGATLPIRSEREAGEGNRVLVGRSEAVRSLGVSVPSGFTPRIDEEGFVIQRVGKDLVIAGNEDWNYRGTLYGVHELLERLGCRWFFPGAYGEVVPEMDTIEIGDIDIAERPSFRMRNIWYSGWMPVVGQQGVELARWYDGNKAHALAGLSLPGDGSIIRLAPPEKYFESHPEVYALERDGKTRTREMLCLTEPKTVEIAVKTISDQFRSDPQAVTFGFAPPDGHPLCYCGRCQGELKGFTGKGLGEPSLSDLWFGFVNRVAREVKREFPERWLWTNGYANRVRLPEAVGELSDNIGIQSAVIQACTLHRIGDPGCWQRQDYAQILEQWTEALGCVFIYDYDPGKGLDNLPFPALHNLRHDLPWFKQRGVWGFWTEGHNSWMVGHLNYYVRAKLMWDVEEDVDALVRDYCERFYGRAADGVERYIWTLEEAVDDSPVHLNWGDEVPWRVILPPGVRRELDGHLAAAEEAADTPEDAAHVAVLRLVHEHTTAFLEMDAAAVRGDFRGAVRWADEMQRLRGEVAKVDPALLPSTPEWCRGDGFSLEYYRSFYHELAERTGGARGTLVAMLPREWEFRTDPEGDGQIYRWYLPGAGGRWEGIDTTLHWQLQGYQDERGVGYSGKAWYRTSFHVPADAEGRPLTLTLAGIHNRGVWTWVNGFLADYRERQDSRRPLDVEVTGRIAAGRVNHVAVMVNTPPGSDRGGLHRRAFLWSPQ